MQGAIEEHSRVMFGTTAVKISIGDDAFALRVVAASLIIVWLILAWVSVSSISTIATSIRSRERFTPANAQRVRRLGGVVLAHPILTFLGRLFLRQLVGTLDLAGPAVTVDIGVADWWAWILLRLLMVSIAEPLAHGVSLQALDEVTI